MTVGVGVIGTGPMGRDHIRRIARGQAVARLAAVASRSLENAREAVGDLAEVSQHTDGIGLITDPSVDAVLIASPASTHEAYILAALEAGKPVFCEKPLTDTGGASLRIVSAEAALGQRLVQVGFMRRYDPAYRRLKRALASGSVGAPLLYHSRHRNPETPASWHGEMPLVDAAPHDFDIIRWLLDTDLTSVHVFSGRRDSARADLADPLFVMLETMTGTIATVELSMNVRYGYDIQGELIGEHGVLSLAAAEPIAPDWQSRFAGAFDAEIQEWVDDIAAGRGSTGPSAWDGYVAQAASTAAVESLAAGRATPLRLIAQPDVYREQPRRQPPPG